MSHNPSFRDSGNFLIDRLPPEEFEEIKAKLQLVPITLKQVVCQYEADVNYVYFPTSGLMSLLTVLDEDDPVEAATVGREGLVGVEVALGIEVHPYRAICQLGGDTYQMTVFDFQEALKLNPALARLVKRYVAYYIREASQSLACNALHAAEARACRWLLMMHDQAGRDEFPMTQEFLAFMLGVRRQTVTVIAGSLQNAGLIEFRRGAIKVRQRALLEEAACECYATIRRYYQRVVF